MPLGICRLIRVSFDTKLSAILIFRGIHFGHTAKVNFAEAIVYEKTIVSAVSATSAEFTWPKTSTHQFFSSVSVVSCKCVSRRWKEWFPVSKYFFLKLLMCSFLLLGHVSSPVLKLLCNTSNLGGLWFQLSHIFDTRELVTQGYLKNRVIFP